MARKIAVMIRKGGSGKTTTANNLSAALVQQGSRALLVDIDVQRNATKGVGINPDELKLNINHLFAGKVQDPREVLVTTRYGLDVLPAHADLAQTERGMRPDQIWSLQELLAPLNDAYDFIIIDNPPADSFLTLSSLIAADDVLVPLQAGAWSEEGLADLLTQVARTRQKLNRSLRVLGILPTMVERTVHSNTVLSDVSSDYESLVLPFS